MDTRDDAAPRRRPHPRAWWAAGLFAAFVSAQLAIPTLMLAGPRPSRFGWQMYAGFRALDVYTAVRHDGSTAPIDLRAFFGNLRADAYIAPAMFVPHVCGRHSDARAVRVRHVMSGDTEEYTCSSE